MNRIIKNLMLVMLLGFSQAACDEDLDEKPLDFLNSDVLLVNPQGFNSAITGLYEGVRWLYFREDGARSQAMFLGTDVAMTGDRSLADFKNYKTWLNPTQISVQHYWDAMYLNVVPRANTIIEYANRPTAQWTSEEEKNRVVAEARFFRAYAYNFLANLYGGVPLVEGLPTAPKVDYERATREQVYDFARQDLEFASQWLPATPPQDGRVSKAAADHLLTEVYINLKQYDKAIASASQVINGGQHQLMTARFGKYVNQPGDVISDLHAQDNQNRSAGNQETIWNLQFEPRSTPGGTVLNGQFAAVNWLRAWGPTWWNINDPAGKAGMQLSVDSLGRGVGWVRPTDYFTYHIWSGNPTDIRNSKHNIRRSYYYNNPASAFFRQKVDPTKVTVDTMTQYYPMITKIEGNAELTEGANYGRAFKDVYLMRLAETYLLRAEAYFLSNQVQEAANDINVVRARANATPVSANQVNLDYILDERARELIIEENRRLTLNRMGKLAERVRLYNPLSGSSVEAYHELYPIPQTAIDANFGKKLEQNQGY